MRKYTLAEIQHMAAIQTPLPAAYYDAAEVKRFCHLLVDGEKQRLYILVEEAMRIAKQVAKG